MRTVRIRCKFCLENIAANLISTRTRSYSHGVGMGEFERDYSLNPASLLPKNSSILNACCLNITFISAKSVFPTFYSISIPMEPAGSFALSFFTIYHPKPTQLPSLPSLAHDPGQQSFCHRHTLLLSTVILNYNFPRNIYSVHIFMEELKVVW